MDLETQVPIAPAAPAREDRSEVYLERPARGGLKFDALKGRLGRVLTLLATLPRRPLPQHWTVIHV